MDAPVSIIVPVYKEKRLEETLLSIRAQSRKPQEVIIVVDGETEPFETHFRVIRIEHAGASTARNVGFTASSEPYVLFLDSDTLLYPNYLEKMLEAIDGYEFSYCDFLQSGIRSSIHHAQPFDAEKLKDQNYIDTISLIDRTCLSDTPFDPSLGRFQDWDLWLTLSAQGFCGAYVPEVLMSKWFDAQGLSAAQDSAYWEQMVRQKHHLSCIASS